MEAVWPLQLYRTGLGLAQCSARRTLRDQRPTGTARRQSLSTRRQADESRDLHFGGGGAIGDGEPDKQASGRRGMRVTPGLFYALLLACSGPALAELGGAPMAVQADGVHGKAILRESDVAGFSIHELQLPSGTTVREYVSPENQVFALSWQGPFMPNLQELLSGYFDHYASAAARHAYTGRRPVDVKKPEVVIHAGGHLRAFQGHAYLPGRFPPGVTLDDIR